MADDWIRVHVMYHWTRDGGGSLHETRMYDLPGVPREGESFHPSDEWAGYIVRAVLWRPRQAPQVRVRGEPPPESQDPHSWGPPSAPPPHHDP